LFVPEGGLADDELDALFAGGLPLVELLETLLAAEPVPTTADEAAVDPVAAVLNESKPTRPAMVDRTAKAILRMAGLFLGWDAGESGSRQKANDS
jgi:hypothetical protein